MKKNAIVILFLLSLSLSLSGCIESKDDLSLVKENMSEYGEVYFYSDNMDLPMSVVSGFREEPYKYDGKSSIKFDFALVVARLDNADDEYLEITIDGEREKVLLKYNYLTGTHVADLQRKLSGDENISIFYLGKEANMVCKSKEFAVSAEKALEIGTEYFSEKIAQLRVDDDLNAECYLKLLDNVSGGFKEVYWLFSIYSLNGEMSNVIISTVNGQILANDGQNLI